MTTDVRVNPPSIVAYGATAQENFGAIRGSLETLVADAVSIDYYGPNAVDFKTQCGVIAADLANALLTDMIHIASAVRDTTTNISFSLGGQPIDIQFNGSPISPPAVPAGDGSVGVNLPALDGFKSTATTHFGTIADLFAAHLRSLQDTDWIGTAKENAVGAVTSFTNSARAKVDEANAEMADYVTRQLESVNAANR